MAYRSIVCLNSGFEFEASSLATAFALAKASNAHLRIVHAEYVVHPSAMVFGEAAILSTGWAEAVDRQLAADRTRAKEAAATAAAKAGLPLATAGETALPRAEFISMQSVSNRGLSRTLSMCDLIIMGGPKGAAGWAEDSIANLALFSTGRPVWLVRPLGDGAPANVRPKTAMIAWSPTPEALHALRAAVPLLALAEAVHLVSASSTPATEATEEEALALAYLAAHGINAQRDALGTGGKSPAEAVLSHARAAQCDTLVMGAYGHSLFREMMIGGFSETMITNAEFPLLLCH
ncbi:MAG: universal stress protein [Pseudomonadota bacterium]